MAGEAMAKREETESQEAPSLEQTEAPGAPSEPKAPGPALPPAATAAGSDDIAQDELQQFREWQRERAEAKNRASPSSPPKKQKTDETWPNLR